MTQKHTPTPWVAVHRGTKKDIAKGNDYFRVGREIDVSDPDLPCIHIFGTRKEANAAHIVKCVNMHDELVEALERARVYMKEEFNNIDDTGDEFSIVEHIEEALKKAGAL